MLPYTPSTPEESRTEDVCCHIRHQHLKNHGPCRQIHGLLNPKLWSCSNWALAVHCLRDLQNSPPSANEKHAKHWSKHHSTHTCIKNSFQMAKRWALFTHHGFLCRIDQEK